MEHIESSFVGVGGRKIYFQYWRLESAGQVSPRALLAINHGLGDHGGRFPYLVDYMVARDIWVYALDHRGHGRSEGQRGHINNWNELREDLHTFLELVRQQTPDRPLFLLGHSLGGLMVLDYALVYPQGLQGVIVSAPAVMQTAISPFKVLLAKTLSRVAPSFSLATGLDYQGISRDPVEVQRYQQDPLVHEVGTVRLGAEAFAAQERTLAAAASFKPALLMVHGDADRLVPVRGSQTFYERVTQPDKRIIIYPGGYHEPHNDEHRQQYFDDLVAWIEEHC